MLALLVPAKAGHDTIAIALVLDLKHHALIRFVGSGDRLSDDAVEAGALEATKPIGSDASIDCCGRQVKRRLGG